MLTAYEVATPVKGLKRQFFLESSIKVYYMRIVPWSVLGAEQSRICAIACAQTSCDLHAFNVVSVIHIFVVGISFPHLALFSSRLSAQYIVSMDGLEACSVFSDSL